jgi:hypothetical protein
MQHLLASIAVLMVCAFKQSLPGQERAYAAFSAAKLQGQLQDVVGLVKGQVWLSL